MGVKKQVKKLTLEDFLAKKLQKEHDKAQLKEVYIESLGGDVTLQKCKLNIVLETMDKITADESMTNIVEAYKYLIYNSIPILKNTELQEQYESVEPYDIVTEIFELGEILELGEEILSFYGMDKLEEKVKN